MNQTDRQIPPLNKCVQEALKNYFKNLDGHPPSNLYQMVLEQVEIPLLEAILLYTKNNQSEAATILGISRGTLRNKIKEYKLGQT